MQALSSLCKMRSNHTSWNASHKEMPSFSRNLCTTQKIEALCYLSGENALFSRYVGDRDREFFIPSRNIIFSRTAMHYAEKPSNTISWLINREGERVEFETDLVPAALPQEAVDQLQKLHQECDGIYDQISALEEKQNELRDKIHVLFSDLCAKAPLLPEDAS